MGYLDSSGLSHFWAKIKTVLGGKQDSLTIGDGLSLNDNTISVTEPIKGLAKAEYDALTEEQKSSGFYVVTDTSINLNDRGEVYSTEETRIGTWIDGKPIYSKTLIATSLATTGKWQTLGHISDNIETVIDITATIRQPGSKSIWEVLPVASTPTANPGSQIFAAECQVSETSGNLEFINKNADYLISSKIICTCKYTKTTDTELASQTNLLMSNINSFETPLSVSYAPASASSFKINL